MYSKSSARLFRPIIVTKLTEVDTMDELAKETEIAKFFSAVALPPMAVENEIAVQRGIKIPLSRITALGTGLEPVVSVL